MGTESMIGLKIGVFWVVQDDNYTFDGSCRYDRVM